VHHLNVKPFKCDFCSKVCYCVNRFHYSSYLSYECSILNLQSYSLQSNLYSHLLTAHEIENFAWVIIIKLATSLLQTIDTSFPHYFQSSNDDTAQNRRPFDSLILRGKAVPLPINGTNSRHELPADLKWKTFFGVKECSVVLERIDFKNIRMF